MQPKYIPALTPADVKRFWSKVDRSAGPDACWPWTAGRLRSGYGMMSLCRNGAQRSVIASRVAWTLANDADIPAGLIVRHSCDNPPCCNPAHLLIGTTRDNVRDAMERGRVGPSARLGSLNRNARLTEDDVRAIRGLMATGRVASYELARRYGVSYASMHQVVAGKTWRHVK